VVNMDDRTTKARTSAGRGGQEDEKEGGEEEKDEEATTASESRCPGLVSCTSQGRAGWAWVVVYFSSWCPK